MRGNGVAKFTAPIAVLCIVVLIAWSGTASWASHIGLAGDAAQTKDMQVRTVFAERTVAGASCTGKADWRIRILPSTRKELGFEKVVLRNAAPQSRWRIVNQEIRGDDTDVELINLRASDNGRVQNSGHGELIHAGLGWSLTL